MRGTEVDFERKKKEKGDIHLFSIAAWVKCVRPTIGWVYDTKVADMARKDECPLFLADALVCHALREASFQKPFHDASAVGFGGGSGLPCRPVHGHALCARRGRCRSDCTLLGYNRQDRREDPTAAGARVGQPAQDDARRARCARHARCARCDRCRSDCTLLGYNRQDRRRTRRPLAQGRNGRRRMMPAVPAVPGMPAVPGVTAVGAIVPF